MNIKKLLLGSLAMGGLLAALRLLFARPASIQTAPGSASQNEIDRYIEDQMRHLSIPGAALAIVEGGRIVHLRGFGQARPGGETPGAQTPFFIGSLTKSFTALAVMQLAEAGQVGLDQPLQHYLPWFHTAPAPDGSSGAGMTVRHLLNQTSGLPGLAGMINLGDFDDRPSGAQRQARALATLAPARTPGSAFEYSNLNYLLLGLVVEAVSGESYATYIHRHIFDPLGMRHSYTARAAARRDGLAMGHRYWFGVPIAAPELPIPIATLAAGQLISCAEDMARYLSMYLNGGRYAGGQLLSEAGILEMLSGAAEIVEMGQSFGSYGMGWIDQGTGAARIVSHSGIVPDFGAFMALVPAQNKGMLLLLNVNHAIVKMTFDELGLGAAQRLAGLPPTPPQFGAAPWVMRGLALIPLLQVAGIAATLRRLRRWQRDPTLRPGRGRLWAEHILLPLIPNLSFAAGLVAFLTSGIHRFARVFMPDAYWLTLIGGGIAAIWALLRTWLMLRTPPAKS